MSLKEINDLQQIQDTLVDLNNSCSADGSKGDCPILNALEGKNETGRQLRK